MRTGLFDESIRSGIEDFDLWQRITPISKGYFISATLGHYHNRPGNLTNGRYYAKWRDSMRIAWKYRKRVTVFDMMARVGIASLEYGWLGLSDIARTAIADRPRPATAIQPDNSKPVQRDS